MKQAQIEQALDFHGVEVWDGYAVNVYTVRDGDQVITGESFTPINTLEEPAALADFLNY